MPLWGRYAGGDEEFYPKPPPKTITRDGRHVGGEMGSMDGVKEELMKVGVQEQELVKVFFNVLHKPDAVCRFAREYML